MAMQLYKQSPDTHSIAFSDRLLGAKHYSSAVFLKKPSNGLHTAASMWNAFRPTIGKVKSCRV